MLYTPLTSLKACTFCFIVTIKYRYITTLQYYFILCVYYIRTRTGTRCNVGARVCSVCASTYMCCTNLPRRRVAHVIRPRLTCQFGHVVKKSRDTGIHVYFFFRLLYYTFLTFYFSFPLKIITYTVYN